MGPVSQPKGKTWEAAKTEKNWLVYKLVPQEGKKPRKIPQTVDGNSTAPKAAACLNFDDAFKAAECLGAEFGIGYLPRENSALVCIDFDGVLKDGVLVEKEMPTIVSYTEVSPSRTGLHVLVRRPDDQAPLTFDDGNDWVGFLGSDSKFFTVSLDLWADCQEIVEDANLVEWVLARHQDAVFASNAAQVKRETEWGELRARQESALHSHWFYKLPTNLRAKCAAELLAVLPPKYCNGYDTWLQAGMALKLADTQGELFEVWDNWSRGAPNYDGGTREKWDQLSASLAPDKKMVTISTLIFWAKESGWAPGPWESVAHSEQIKKVGDALKAPSLNDVTRPAEPANPEEKEPRIAAKTQTDLTPPGGLVEALADFGERKSSRLSRIPALAGALAAVSVLTQRNYIVETTGFVTSPGLLVTLVCETGAGKEIARDIIYAVCSLNDQIGLAESYASGQALHKALGVKPVQIWANDEFGRFLKAAAQAKTGAHDYGLITMTTKLHTMYGKFLPERIYSSSEPYPRVDHPLMVAMHTTSPKALYDAMDADTVVDGVLGRLLVIQQKDRPALKPLSELDAAGLPPEIKKRLENLSMGFNNLSLENSALAGDQRRGDRMVTMETGHKFRPITATDEASLYLEGIRQECDKRMTPGVAAALWSRAYEQVLRVAGVVAFGHAVMDDNLAAPKITKNILFWARDFVFHCLEELVPEAEDHASDGERDKLQKAITRKIRNDADEDGWIRKQTLLQGVKGRGRSSRDVTDEINALIECGDIEVETIGEGEPARPERLRLCT